MSQKVTNKYYNKKIWNKVNACKEIECDKQLDSTDGRADNFHSVAPVQILPLPCQSYTTENLQCIRCTFVIDDHSMGIISVVDVYLTIVSNYLWPIHPEISTTQPLRVITRDEQKK